jgi:predicted RNA binding protein YcfA (HicA-like mRNA interferase family)
MKKGGARGAYIKPLMKALKAAGYEFARRNNSHFHYKAPGRPRITVPEKLDDIHIAKRIAKIAGVEL